MYAHLSDNRRKMFQTIRKFAWANIVLSVIFFEFFIVDSFKGYFWIPAVLLMLSGILLHRLNKNFNLGNR